MLAAAGHTAIVQQQQQQQPQQQQHQTLAYASAYPSNNALTSLSNTLSSMQYSNRGPLPAPLASLPPLALSFSTHTSNAVLTPSAAGNSGLSSFASSLHSNLFKNANNSTGMMSQLVHGVPHAAMTVHGAGGINSSPHSPLSVAVGSGLPQQSNGVSWPHNVPSAATAPASPQPYSASSQSGTPTSTPPAFQASASQSSLASLSALALPASSAPAAASELSAMSSASALSVPPLSMGIPVSPTVPMLPYLSGTATSTLSPYAYSSSTSATNPSSLTQAGSFTRLPSLPLNLPSPTVQSLYPAAHMSHLLPSLPASYTASASSASSPSLSSASFASLSAGGSSSSPLLSNVGGSTNTGWSMATPSAGSNPQLNRYLIHFPADTAHGAQSGLYQPGKPSQLIIHMAGG